MGSKKSPHHPDVDILLPLGPAKLLSASGFKRSGRNFVRHGHVTVAGVYFRTSQFGANTFQVLLSVFLPAHHELVSGRPFPSNPFPGKAVALVGRDVCAPRETGSDSPWWQISFGIEIEPMASSLTLALQGALPFFDAWSDPAEVRERLLSGGVPGAPIHLGTAALASLFLHAGDVEAADRALQESALPTALLSAVSARLRARLLAQS